MVTRRCNARLGASGGSPDMPWEYVARHSTRRRRGDEGSTKSRVAMQSPRPAPLLADEHHLAFISDADGWPSCGSPMLATPHDGTERASRHAERHRARQPVRMQRPTFVHVVARRFELAWCQQRGAVSAGSVIAAPGRRSTTRVAGTRLAPFDDWGGPGPLCPLRRGDAAPDCRAGGQRRRRSMTGAPGPSADRGHRSGRTEAVTWRSAARPCTACLSARVRRPARRGVRGPWSWWPCTGEPTSQALADWARRSRRSSTGWTVLHPNYRTARPVAECLHPGALGRGATHDVAMSRRGIRTRERKSRPTPALPPCSSAERGVTVCSSPRSIPSSCRPSSPGACPVCSPWISR